MPDLSVPEEYYLRHTDLFQLSDLPDSIMRVLDQSDSFFHEKHPRSGAIHPDSFSLKFYLFLSDTVPALSADVLEYPQASPASSNDICEV